MELQLGFPLASSQGHLTVESVSPRGEPLSLELALADTRSFFESGESEWTVAKAEETLNTDNKPIIVITDAVWNRNSSSNSPPDGLLSLPWLSEQLGSPLRISSRGEETFLEETEISSSRPLLELPLEQEQKTRAGQGTADPSVLLEAVTVGDAEPISGVVLTVGRWGNELEAPQEIYDNIMTELRPVCEERRCPCSTTFPSLRMRSGSQSFSMPLRHYLEELDDGACSLRVRVSPALLNLGVPILAEFDIAVDPERIMILENAQPTALMDLAELYDEEGLTTMAKIELIVITVIVLFILSLPLFLLCFLRNIQTLEKMKSDEISGVEAKKPQEPEDPDDCEASRRQSRPFSCESPIHTMEYTLSLDGFQNRSNTNRFRPSRSQPLSLPKIKRLGPTMQQVGDVVINQNNVVIFNMNDQTLPEQQIVVEEEESDKSNYDVPETILERHSKREESTQRLELPKFNQTLDLKQFEEISFDENVHSSAEYQTVQASKFKHPLAILPSSSGESEEPQTDSADSRVCLSRKLTQDFLEKRARWHKK